MIKDASAHALELGRPLCVLLNFAGQAGRRMTKEAVNYNYAWRLGAGQSSEAGAGSAFARQTGPLTPPAGSFGQGVGF